MKKMLLSIIGITILCLVSGCGRSKPYEYKDVEKYLNNLSIEVHQPDKSKWYNLDLNLKDKVTLKNNDNDKWTFYVNDYQDLEFTVTSSYVKDEIWGNQGYVLTDNYGLKSVQYFFDKFINENNYSRIITDNCSFSFQAGNAHYNPNCQYNNSSELKEQTKFLSEFLNYLSNLDIKVVFNTFDFKNGENTKCVYIGIQDKKLIPMYAEGSSYKKYKDFVNDLLRETGY